MNLSLSSSSSSSSFVHAGSITTASFLCSQMMEKGHIPPEKTFISVLSAFIGKRQYQKASELFQQAGTLAFAINHRYIIIQLSTV